MSETCIRRPNSYWPHCRCSPCRADFLRKAKLYRNGRYARLPSSAAWAVIDSLRSRGWSARAIASAAGLKSRALDWALDQDDAGHRCEFGPIVTARIVDHGDPTDGSVGAIGTTRRLQGLAIQGYDLVTLGQMTGVPWTSLAGPRTGSTKSVRAHLYVAVKSTTEEIGMRIGPSTDAPRRAGRKGWRGLLAWDEDTIDDLAAEPCAPAEQQKRSRALPPADDLRWLLHEINEPIDRVAQRYGVSVGAVERALRRAA